MTNSDRPDAAAPVLRITDLAVRLLERHFLSWRNGFEGS